MKRRRLIALLIMLAMQIVLALAAPIAMRGGGSSTALDERRPYQVADKSMEAAALLRTDAPKKESLIVKRGLGYKIARLLGIKKTQYSECEIA